jgi:hypothetical protein
MSTGQKEHKNTSKNELEREIREIKDDRSKLE